MAVKPAGVLRGPQTFYGFKQECDIIKYMPPNRAREFRTAYSRLANVLLKNLKFLILEPILA